MYSVEDKRKVFEASGRREFKTEGSYSFLFTVPEHDFQLTRSGRRKRYCIAKEIDDCFVLLKLQLFK